MVRDSLHFINHEVVYKKALNVPNHFILFKTNEYEIHSLNLIFFHYLLISWWSFDSKMTSTCTKFKRNVRWINTFLMLVLLQRRQHSLYNTK